MSLLQMFACEACGATASAETDICGIPRDPEDWLVIDGPSTMDELDEVRASAFNKPPTHHVCSPVCLVVLAERLVEQPGAMEPVTAAAR